MISLKSARTISLLLSITVGSLVTGVLHILGYDEIIYTSLIVFVIVYSVSYVALDYLLYRDLHKMIQFFNEIKSGTRIEKTEFNKNKPKLPITKELYEEVYSYLLLKQQQIDEMARIAAFRKHFIADVSHELKTPIFAAQGFVHTLLDGADQDEKVRRRFLEKAAKSLDGLDLLVHDLLTLSHIEIGETKMQFEYFDIKALAEEVIEQFDSKRGDRKLEVVESGLKKTPMIVYADWLRIKQVVINLVSNAIKYSQNDGEIQITLEEQYGTIAISVQDNGEGIPTQDLHRIFERFYRVDKSRSRGKGGTGLGLAIVKHIIEGHHSKIEVESKFGQGSVFKFTLPKGKKQ